MRKFCFVNLLKKRANSWITPIPWISPRPKISSLGLIGGFTVCALDFWKSQSLPSIWATENEAQSHWFGCSFLQITKQKDSECWKYKNCARENHTVAVALASVGSRFLCVLQLSKTIQHTRTFHHQSIFLTVNGYLLSFNRYLLLLL